MATIPVFTAAGQQAGEMELAAEVFGIEPNQALVVQSVLATLAGRRQGTADTKTRGEVKHTTRKLFKQKGTGRARQGMKSAPHWKGGGVVFGPHPRDYSQSLPKKMRRKALLSALSAKIAAGGIIVLDEFPFEQPRTKVAVSTLTALGLADTKVLVVLAEPTPAILLSFRNLPNVLVTTTDRLGTYDVLLADRLLFSQASLAHLQALKQQPLGIERWRANQHTGGVA
jgi:large subunit ribosomal protein L4